MPIISENSGWNHPPALRPTGLFVTDLDGTLLRSDRTFAAADLEALRRLGECGVVRVLATGRSLFSFEKVRTPDLPLDYLVFSTGAGLAELPSGRIVRAQSLDPAEVRCACEVLRALGLDFMVQRPIPETHAFGFHASGRTNPDFDRRIALYARFAFPLDGDAAGFGPATQLVAILPPEGPPETLPEVRRLLPELTVIRTTSPLDHRSTWIEIFPASVSKSRTTGWLADRLGIPPARTASVGNDYNDLDLLDWSAERFVTANAPPDLRQRYPVVATNDDCGMSQAAGLWLEKLRIDQ
jgi:hydroxymethylpyrimidine pyrophosphatase-like HAD family hydrolase